MSNRIEINAWGIRGSVRVPAYAMDDGENSHCTCIANAIARKNRADKWGTRIISRSADGSEEIIAMVMTHRNGEVIGEVTYRVDLV